jgi:hypothetical protein
MNWKAKSAAAIVAGGLAHAGDAQAQPLNTNLVQNPSFETVSNISGAGATVSAGWSGPNLQAYNYSGNYTGPAPTGAGSWYWHGGSAASVNANQTIDLLVAGFTPAQLDGGGLGYNLSAFFSGYRTQGDYAAVQATFLDASGGTVATRSIGGQAFTDALPTVNNGNYPDAKVWGQDSASAVIPAGTRGVRIDLNGTRLAGNSCDGYVDLVDFRVSAVPEPGTFLLTGAGGLVYATFRIRRRRPGDEPAPAG